jgi:hypothetical protein
MVCPQVADGGNCLHMWRVNAISNHGQPTRVGWSFSWGGANNSLPLKKAASSIYEMLHRALNLAGSCERGNNPMGSIQCWVFLEW